MDDVNLIVTTKERLEKIISDCVGKQFAALVSDSPKFSDYVNRTQAASILGTTPHKVNMLVKEGLLTMSNPNARACFKREDVMEFRERRELLITNKKEKVKYHRV